MDDAGGILNRNSHELEQVSRRVWTDDEQPLLAVILELGEFDGVLPCVNDRTLADPVLAGRGRNLHSVKGTLTTRGVKRVLTLDLAGTEECARSWPPCGRSPTVPLADLSIR